ncbi:MAG: hypothetical protein IKP00_09400 [Victivallales bacterium]|nr:hypothetical protein [Victivallales bacterium]
MFNVNNNNFLWVTRGKKWGFRFLSKCSLLASYYEVIYRTVFLSDESRFGYWKGIITFENTAPIPYVACRCYDDNCIQQDEAKRRIPHEFLFLCSNNEYNELKNLAWGTLVMEQLREQYTKLFDCTPSEVNNCQLSISFQITPDIEESESCITLDIKIPLTSSNQLTATIIPLIFSIFLFYLLNAYVIFHYKYTIQKARSFQRPQCNQSMKCPPIHSPIPPSVGLKTSRKYPIPPTPTNTQLIEFQLPPPLEEQDNCIFQCIKEKSIEKQNTPQSKESLTTPHNTTPNFKHVLDSP